VADALQPVSEDLAAWLRARRTHLLLSQEELAARAGLGTRTVRDIEAGRARPRATTRRLLEEALDEATGSADLAHPALLPSDVHAFTGRGP
jgi:transcriptional regulator with XRE-family HTH domain